MRSSSFSVEELYNFPLQLTASSKLHTDIHIRGHQISKFTRYALFTTIVPPHPPPSLHKSAVVNAIETRRVINIIIIEGGGES
jgi:hypothetical protein